MQRAFLVFLNCLKQAGVETTKHLLDNKVSNKIKEPIRDTCKLELVPPDCHCRNITEMAIKTFKQYYF